MNSDSDIDFVKKLNLFEIQCITGSFIENEVCIDLELYLNSNDYELIKDLGDIMKSIAIHDFKKILECEYKCLSPFKEVCKDFTLVFYEMCSQMKSNYQYLFHPDGENCPYVKQLILLFVGVAALQEFVRVNFSGPFEPHNIVYPICAEFLPDSHFSNDSVLDALARDGEVILAELSHPKLLYLSLMLLFGNSFDKCLTHKWWLLRCLRIHQKLLPDPIIGLHKSITSLINKQSRMDFLIHHENLLAEVMFYVECAQVYLYYSEINIAKRYLISAQNVLGLGVKFNVAFNKRTLSKENFVTVKRNDNRYKTEFLIGDCEFPPIHIPFDTDSIDFDFIGWDSNNHVDLLPEEQMVLLTYCDLFQTSKGCQSSEEDIIILQTLLSQPKIWALQVKALFSLCKKKKPAQSLKFQIQEFLEVKEKENPPFSCRQNLMFCALPPLNYELHELLSDCLLPKESLSLCEQQHIWSKACVFYSSDQFRKRGKKTLEELIAIKPSSLLWCYLGNICEKVGMLKVAWDLSHHTSARSQRYLGKLFSVTQMYPSSIEHNKISLLVNPLQPEVLCEIGKDAMLFGDCDLAIESYRRILEMDDCNFSVWDSLSYAHIIKGQNIDASRSILEVQSNENSNNYALFCSKIGDFKSVIRFYKSKTKSVRRGLLTFDSIDVEVLQTLVEAVIVIPPGCRSYFLKSSTSNLFKRITRAMKPNIEIWDLHYNFINSTMDKSDIKFLRLSINLLHRIINYSLKHILLKGDKFNTFLQYVSRYITLAKYYATKAGLLRTYLYYFVKRVKLVLSRTLSTVRTYCDSELSRNESDFQLIADQADFFLNWNVSFNEPSESQIRDGIYIGGV